ncbi:lipase family protein [Isobaculum melis]|uniref:Lipase (Class 3) n=1 Tax=Isobaculum melis TaxID=142588 RepID=A0A1H9TJT9_9LACT|nr:hypothetical protein [Isobaculum melis]SER97327.1 Lipase (class 3) [Isobaculum melis]
MAQLTEEQYFNLADEVYDDKYIHAGDHIQTEDGSYWITINAVDQKSGLQAIAVVPLKDYQAMQAGKITSYPTVVFSSRGSQTDNLGELVKDWIETDLGDLAIAQKPEHYKEQDLIKNEESQFIGYESFVNETLKKYPIKDYSFTGHSLGGALAQYMAVLKDKRATTFAAAKAYRLLPKDLQELVDSGYFMDKIIDYRHKFDPVGHVPFGNVIGKQYLAKSSKNDIPFMGHTRDSFKGMFKGGKVQILFSPEELRSHANKLMMNQEIITDIQLAFRQYQDYEYGEIDDFVRQMRTSDEFYDLEDHEMTDILSEMFPYREGNYFMHHPEISEKIDLYCRTLAEKIYQLSDSLKASADEADKTDRVLAKDIQASRSFDIKPDKMKPSVTGPQPIES